MPGYFAALTLVMMLGMVLVRILVLERKGIEAMHYGREYLGYCSRVRRYS